MAPATEFTMVLSLEEFKDEFLPTTTDFESHFPANMIEVISTRMRDIQEEYDNKTALERWVRFPHSRVPPLLTSLLSGSKLQHSQTALNADQKIFP